MPYENFDILVYQNCIIGDLAGTMVLWDRSTGRIHNAIVWQDRRTAEQCEACAPGATGMAAEKAGRLIAPYVSVT